MLPSLAGGMAEREDVLFRDSRDGAGYELDIENFGHCWASMNIGIMYFPGGKRPGTIKSIAEATAHLLAEGNLARVDQGPINYR